MFYVNQKSRLGFGIFTNFIMTQSPLGCNGYNTFKYRIRKDAYHNRLRCTPVAYGIRNILRIIKYNRYNVYNEWNFFSVSHKDTKGAYSIFKQKSLKSSSVQKIDIDIKKCTNAHMCHIKKLDVNYYYYPYPRYASSKTIDVGWYIISIHKLKKLLYIFYCALLLD